MITELDAMNKITNALSSNLSKLNPDERKRTLLWLSNWITDQLDLIYPPEQEDQAKSGPRAVSSS